MSSNKKVTPSNNDKLSEVLNYNDFVVASDGSAFISQTKVAELCGVGQDAISKFLKRRTGHTYILNEFNQLHSDSMELVIGYYAFDSQRPTEKAVESYRMIAKAGAKAYIYHQAGYAMSAARPIVPLTIVGLATENHRLSGENLKFAITNEKLKKKNTELKGSNALLKYEIMDLEYLNTNLEDTIDSQAIALDESREWSTINRQEKATGGKYDWRVLTKWHEANGIARKKVFAQNYTSVKSYCAQAWLEVYDVEL